MGVRVFLLVNSEADRKCSSYFVMCVLKGKGGSQREHCCPLFGVTPGS